MKPKSLLDLFGVAIALLLIIACALPGAGTPQSASTDEPITGGGAPITDAGLCANQYYPVRQGATWTYKSTGGPSGEYSFTDTISSVRTDGFTLTSQFPDVTRTQEWACREEGLVALQLGGGPAATLNASGSNLVMQTQNAQGVTFPKTIRAGDAWQHTLDFTGTMDIAGQPADADGSATAQFTALGMESVSIPLGTFNVMKIQIDNTIMINATFQGLTMPVAFVDTTTSWFAEGVGWVKAVASGTMGETAFTETIELQSYTLP